MEIPKCINGNKAVLICASKCDRLNPFMCAGCQCKQIHQSCQITMEWNKFKNNIEKIEKANKVTVEFTTLRNRLEQTIRNTITNLQKQIQYFRIWIQRSIFGKQNQIANLFKCIKDNQQNKYTGREVAKIFKEIESKQQINIFNENQIRNQMEEIINRMREVHRTIRKMYDNISNEFLKEKEEVKNIKDSFTSKPPQQMAKQNTPTEKSLILKEYTLKNLIKKLRELNEQPVYLELKFAQTCTSDYHFEQQYLKQLGDTLRPLKTLNTFILYYPYTLGQNFSESQRYISTALATLPKLQSITIVANGVKNASAFKSIDKKLKIGSLPEGWSKSQWS